MIKNLKGFLVLGTMVAVLILASFGATLMRISATNQETRTAQLFSAQAFYSSHAAFEYALRRIRVDNDYSAPPSREFAGETMSINYNSTCANELDIIVTTTKGDASNSFSLSNLEVTPNCLIAQTSQVSFSGSSNEEMVRLRVRNFAQLCSSPDYEITAMKIEWTPDGGERITDIQIGGDPVEYSSGSGLGSGSVFDFGSNDFAIDSSGWIFVEPIVFDSNMSSTQRTYTITWYIDGQAQCDTTSFSA